MTTIPFSERDLKTLLDSGKISMGPIKIVLHPQATVGGFLKVIEARVEKEKAAIMGKDIYVADFGEPDDPDAYKPAVEVLAAEEDGKQLREKEEE